MIVVGDYLYSSCRGADYGRVLSVTLTKTSPRTNGLPHGRIDILLNPAEVGKILRDVPFKVNPSSVKFKQVVHGPSSREPFEVSIECETPDPGCYRCDQLFWLHKYASEWPDAAKT